VWLFCLTARSLLSWFSLQIRFLEMGEILKCEDKIGSACSETAIRPAPKGIRRSTQSRFFTEASGQIAIGGWHRSRACEGAQRTKSWGWHLSEAAFCGRRVYKLLNTG
jgi:hypothetical protein